MTLRTKIVLVICLLSAISVATLFLVQNIILSKRFARLERQNTEANTCRVMSAVHEDVSSVSTIVGDWAPWDDTYVFIQDHNSDYITNSLNDETVANIGMNLVLFVNNDGQLVYGKALDLESRTEVPLPASVSQIMSPGSPLLQMSDERSSVSGILSLPEGLLLVAAQPILTSHNEGPVQGALIMGRYLDMARVHRLAELTHLSVSAYSLLQNSDMPDDVQLAQSALSVQDPTFVRPLSKESIAGYGLLTDIYSNPALVLRVDQSRDIYKEGRETIGYVILTLVVLFIWSGAVSTVLMDRFFLSRLSQLAADVDRVGASRNLAERVPDEGHDEFARVAQAINRTLSLLEQAQDELKASETRNRALIASLPDLIIRVDRDGMPVDKGQDKANGFAHATHEPTIKWPGETWEERRAFSLNILQRARPHVKQVLEIGRTDIFEFQSVLGGQVCHYEARVVAGGKDEALIITRDVTQKKHEEEIRRRGVLLKEVHHRVKNNLQVVSGLLYLQSKRISDQNMIEMFNESSNRIQSMSLIHQKLYQSKDANKIDFGGYVRDLVSVLLRSYGTGRSAVKVVLDVNHAGLGMDTAVPCGLIINELVSNSLKHAFPEGRQGEMRIVMRRHDGNKITLVVADDGVGLPLTLDSLNPESLGLQLVVTLVDQLEGTVTLDRDTGTKFTIEFAESQGTGAADAPRETYEHAAA